MQQQGGPAAAEQSQQLPEQHPSWAGGGAGSGRSGDGAERAGGTGVGSHPSPERDCPNFNSGGEGGKEGGRKGGREAGGGRVGRGRGGRESPAPCPTRLPPASARPARRSVPAPPLPPPGRSVAAAWEEKVCRAEGPETAERGGGAARRGDGTDPLPVGAAAAAIFQSHGTVPVRPAPAALFRTSAPPVCGRAPLRAAPRVCERMHAGCHGPSCTRVWWGFLIYLFSSLFLLIKKLNNYHMFFFSFLFFFISHFISLLS